jgi:hypothetical protein
MEDEIGRIRTKKEKWEKTTLAEYRERLILSHHVTV